MILILYIALIVPVIGGVVVSVGVVYAYSFLMMACSILVIEDSNNDEEFSKGNFIE